MIGNRYKTEGGVTVRWSSQAISLETAVDPILEALDSQRGVLLSSSFEYPDRYTRWDIGFVNPPVQIEARNQSILVSALNERGHRLIPSLINVVKAQPEVVSTESGGECFVATIQPAANRFPEQARSRQPSIFSILRAIKRLFASQEDPYLGLYGAFGYDLAFQFEPINLHLKRSSTQRDLVLYLPDELVVVDHRREIATRRQYDFEIHGRSTYGLARDGISEPYSGRSESNYQSDHRPGEYADSVRRAKEAFKRGDLFEAVLSQQFTLGCPEPPSAIFRRLRQRNPAPYGCLINLGDREYLVSASPEMYVRVQGDRVETCPIAGTIARGTDAIGDSDKVIQLLTSRKDEAELTMCTDVDRNDKSRICKPGSVRVIGRRQIEMYSRLIHTADHVEGYLQDGFDALDAFLTHTWEVTVTGAPKVWAMQFIETHEKSPRAWYGGAIGLIGFNGDLNTGLTLRTIWIKGTETHIRAGATLLYDSDPDAEEQETRLKAAALIDAIQNPKAGTIVPETTPHAPQAAKRVLLVDNQDSFVHTLGNYFSQLGAEVITLRVGFSNQEFEVWNPDLVVLSPGPGKPRDFNLDSVIRAARERSLPIFGVCLGLQGIVEHFDGELAALKHPMHGKTSNITVQGGRIFQALPRQFRAGRYHSLYAVEDSLPPELVVTARSDDDGVVMAIEHVNLPIAAVQFHPESIMTLHNEVGLQLVGNVVDQLCK